MFAALNVLDGTVIGRNMQRHRHQEFIRFLNTIDAQVPARKAIHAIVDNYTTDSIRRCAMAQTASPSDVSLHPNFGILAQWGRGLLRQAHTRRRLKRGVFTSVADLQAAISRFLAETNSDAKPFIWPADPKRVLATINRGKQTLERVGSL